jgi:hypothetical protein
MRQVRQLLVAAIVISLLSCEHASNRAIEHDLRGETPIGTTRRAVELWCHQRMIPHGELPITPTDAPRGTRLTIVSGMSNDGRLFNRDVNVYYFFGQNNLLLDLRVRQASDKVFDSLKDVNQERV